MAYTPPFRQSSIRQIALGLFIVWQLVFLIAANLLAFFPHGDPAVAELSDSRQSPDAERQSGPAQDLLDISGTAIDRWAFLTGQVQAWWLFAPSFPHQATFPAVELRWDEGTRGEGKNATPQSVLLLSSLEPKNPERYLKVPGTGDRLFHYESRLGLIMLYWTPDIGTRFPEKWRQAVLDRVTRQWKSIRAYLRWRVLQYGNEHPEAAPPTQAVLHIRIFRTPPPVQLPVDWGQPIQIPLARWNVDRAPSPGHLPIEAFDPVARRFVPLGAN